MKNFFFYLILFSSLISTGQTQQNINKNTGTSSNVIATIDSIRFNSSSTTMEVVLQNGTVESHSIADIVNVNFISVNQSQHSCGADSVRSVLSKFSLRAIRTGVSYPHPARISASILYHTLNYIPYSSTKLNPHHTIALYRCE